MNKNVHTVSNGNNLPFSNQCYCPEFTVLFICAFFFCWIRIRNYNSGSRQKFWIHADPDPQHCLIPSSLPFSAPFLAFLCLLLSMVSISPMRFPLKAPSRLTPVTPSKGRIFVVAKKKDTLFFLWPYHDMFNVLSYSPAVLLSRSETVVLGRIWWKGTSASFDIFLQVIINIFSFCDPYMLTFDTRSINKFSWFNVLVLFM